MGEVIISKHGFETTRVISSRMKRVRSKNTKAEEQLRLALWRRGHRYRKNLTSIPGSPDIAFIGKKLAVFVDGRFWHGYDWANAQTRIRKNREYWIPKIERNMARDQRNNVELRDIGWDVLRFWDFEVESDTEKCVEAVATRLRVR